MNIIFSKTNMFLQHIIAKFNLLSVLFWLEICCVYILNDVNSCKTIEKKLSETNYRTRIVHIFVLYY